MISPERYGVKHPETEEVVFWVERLRRVLGSPFIANEYVVKYGLLESIYPDVVVVNRLDIDEKRTIEGVPVCEFKTPTEWRKLPKGWTWNTRLFDIMYDINFMDLNQYNILDPANILRAYHDGALAMVRDIDYSKFTTEITKQGWRIVRDIYQSEYHPATATLRWDEIYADGEEAYTEVKRLNHELTQTVDMGDHEFNVFTMDNLLNGTPLPSPELRAKYRETLLSLPDFDDLEFRVSSTDGIQWKHWKKQRWNSIQLDER